MNPQIKKIVKRIIPAGGLGERMLSLSKYGYQHEKN